MAFFHARYYLNRIKQLGYVGLKSNITYRLQKKFFAFTNKKNALKKQAGHTWPQLVSTHKLNPDFNLFFQQCAEQKIIQKIATAPDLMVFLPTDYQSIENLIEQADAFVQRRFDILGSGPVQFEAHHIPWQHDFKSSQQTFSNQSSLFYQDITLPIPATDLNGYAPDIKVTWELSRLQHIFVLGRAYQQSNNKDYAQAFETDVDDWITKNPFLLGVNWACPMEVAIRAINLLWGFHFFKHAPTIQASFWGKLLCSLHDHATYLENNWEWSDKPNNHYLADLLGYLYLCIFFKEIPHFKKQQAWCIETLLQQFDKQIQADGTSYEGSTAYHKLDTEIYLHFMLLCKAENITLPPWVKQKFGKMVLFLSDCSDAFGNIVTIGDDDSGKIVTGIKVDDFFKVACCSQRHSSSHSSTAPHSTTYENFGLTIIKKRNWHITFRHPTYTPAQPSGHFHQDALAITLSIAGQPILIDPGTYLYTPNSTMRNHFRSYVSHNTFHMSGQDKPIDQQDLFQLARIPHTQKPNIEHHDSTIVLQDMNIVSAIQGLSAHRTLSFDGTHDHVTIDDWYQQKNMSDNAQIESNWSLIFHPDIQLMQEGTTWNIMKDLNIIAQLKSSLPFKQELGIYAPHYGTLISTYTLTARKQVFVNHKEQILIDLGS